MMTVLMQIMLKYSILMLKMLLTYLMLMECCPIEIVLCSSQVSESEDQVSCGKEQIGICGSVDNKPVEVFDPMIVCLLVWLCIWLCGLLHRFVGIVKAPVVDYDFEVLGRLTHYTDFDERIESNNICQISGKPGQKSTVIIKDEMVYYPEVVPGIIRTLNKRNYDNKIKNVNCDRLQ